MADEVRDEDLDFSDEGVVAKSGSEAAVLAENIGPFDKAVVFPCRLKRVVYSRECRYSEPASMEETQIRTEEGRLFTEHKIADSVCMFGVEIKNSSESVVFLLDREDGRYPVAVCGTLDVERLTRK